MKNLGKVLLVDDDETNNYISAHALRLADAVTHTSVAKNGQEALEMLTTEPYDVVLLGLNLPVMDGFQFMDALKRLQEGAGLQIPPVVILTTSSNSTDKARAAQYPVNGYLTKPLTQEKISQLLHLTEERTA